MSIIRKLASLALAFAVALLCALQAGCIPYAYPNLMHVPAVRLDPTPDPVHAFRVEVRGQSSDDGTRTDDYCLSRIASDNAGRLPAQSDTSFEYGYYALGVAANFPVHQGKTLRVRLYRPGYNLVELRAGEDAKVAWMPATDLGGREHAIDDLLGEPIYDTFALPHRERGRMTTLPASLPPGSRSSAHRDVLLFAADEYERLIAKAKPGQADAERLRTKAAAVRARAAE